MGWASSAAILACGTDEACGWTVCRVGEVCSTRASEGVVHVDVLRVERIGKAVRDGNEVAAILRFWGDGPARAMRGTAWRRTVPQEAGARGLTRSRGSIVPFVGSR
jgi:hypothetical protein